jgi:hypothetical protein
VLVGLGTPAQARGLRATSGWRGPILVDPEARAYAAADLGRLRWWRVASPALVRNALAARREGFSQTKPEGDPWRLGGTLVVRPDGRVALAWRNEAPHDDAPVDDVLAALRAEPS